jgi:hypothetical protein
MQTNDKLGDLPLPQRKLQEDVGKIKDTIISLGALVGMFFVAIDAVTSLDKPAKAILALSFACISLGALSTYLGGKEYPRYGKGLTTFLFGAGSFCLCIVTALIALGHFSSPSLIKVFEVTSFGSRQLLVTAPKRKLVKTLMAKNIVTGEVLPFVSTPGLDADFSGVFLEIAKERDADELVIRELSVKIKDHEELTLGHWVIEVAETHYPRAIEYTAILEPSRKNVFAESDNLTNPQIITNLTVPIQVHLDVAKPGIYTIACRIEVTCYKKKDSRETGPIKFVVFDPAPKLMPKEEKNPSPKVMPKEEKKKT